MSVGELCWVCIGITINAVMFFIGFCAGVVGNDLERKKRVQ
jgi:hypothetical protein